jgi:hypothetical protein
MNPIVRVEMDKVDLEAISEREYRRTNFELQRVEVAKIRESEEQLQALQEMLRNIGCYEALGFRITYWKNKEGAYVYTVEEPQEVGYRCQSREKDMTQESKG